MLTELVSAVSKFIAVLEDEQQEPSCALSHRRESIHVLYNHAVKAIRSIAMSPYKKLLVPFFTRPLTFQSGIKAKIVSGGLLATKFRFVYCTLCDVRCETVADYMSLCCFPFVPIEKCLKRRVTSCL